MDDIISVGNAADAPVQNVGVPVENTSIPVEAGNGGLASPMGNDAIANEMGGSKAAGWSTGQTTVVEPQAPVEYQQQAEPAPLDNLSHEAPAKEDPRRFEYWQSQADRMRGENQMLKQEIGDIKSYLQSREQQSPSNAAPQGSPVPTGNPESGLKAPVQPTKPSNYNEVDAFNDPNSASFQYRNEVDKYRDDVTTYMLKKDQVREKMQINAMRKQQENMINQQAHTHAVNNYGWSPEQANDFIEWSRNPQNVTVDHLAKIYEMSKRGVNPQAQMKRQEMLKQQERAQVPRTTQVTPAPAPPRMSVEQAFSADLLSHSTKPK
jgi:hypothetical protein